MSTSFNGNRFSANDQDASKLASIFRIQSKAPRTAISVIEFQDIL